MCTPAPRCLVLCYLLPTHNYLSLCSGAADRLVQSLGGPGLGEASKGGESWEDSDLGQGSPESPRLSLCAVVFQMYSQEKLVLEELSRYTGARLQPLSGGLY